MVRAFSRLSCDVKTTQYLLAKGLLRGSRGGKEILHARAHVQWSSVIGPPVKGTSVSGSEHRQADLGGHG